MRDKLDDCDEVGRALEWRESAPEQDGAVVNAEGGELEGNVLPPANVALAPARLHDREHGNIAISGSARVQIGDTINYYSHGPLPRADADEITTRLAQTNFTGSYANSLLRPVSTYVSRPHLERQLQDRLAVLEDPGGINETRTVVVWGLGGAGKSQLVLNHIHTHRQQYQTVFWVEAGQKQTLERDFIQIHKLLFPHIAQSDQTISIDDAVTAIKSWFYGRKGQSLWVMDSADVIDDEENPFYIDLNHYLPDAPGLDIIVTTRSSRVQYISMLDAVAVAEMTEDEAARLFRDSAKLRRTSGQVEQETVAIVRELGCLALALTLAGAYVSETPRLLSDVGRYLPEYRAHRKRLLSRKAHRNAHQYSDSVLSTWEMSFAAIERQSLVAARLLSLLAFLNFDDIFPRLFEIPSNSTSPDEKLGSSESAQWLRLLSPEGTAVDEYGIEAGFATLRAYSLVSWRADQEAYVMHKLVHAWGHDRLDIEQRQVWSVAAMHLLSEVTYRNNKDLSLQTRLVPHVLANFSAMSVACGPTYPTTYRQRDALSTLGRLLERLGRWDDEYSVRLFLKQATVVALGPEHPDALTSMENLATVLREQGKYEQAEEMHGQTLKLKKRALGPEHPDTLTSMNNLAEVLRQQGKYEQAEEMHRQTLKLSKKVLGPEHPATQTSLNNLALVLSQQGKYEQAEEMQRQTLMLSKKVLGPEHPDTLTSLNNLVSVLSAQGKHKQAEEMHRQGLKLCEKVLGPQHPNTLGNMDNLAEVLRQQGKYQQAEEMHEQTVKLRKEVLGSEHPDTLTSMNNLATVLRQQGKHEQAEEMYRQTLKLSKKVLGPEHPDTLTSMSNLASLLRQQSKHEQAKEMHGQTLKLRKKVLGPEHPVTLTSMNNLAEVLRQQGKYEQAEEMHRQTLKLSKKVLGPEHPNTLTSLNNLALVLGEQGKHKQAEEMHRQGLKLWEKVLGSEHPNTFTGMDNLAEVLSQQGKYEQAEEMHRQTLKLRKKMLGPEHPVTLTSMSNLAKVLRQQGKYEQAEEMHRQTLKLSKKVPGAQHSVTLASLNNLASVRGAQGKHKQAEEMHRHSVAKLHNTQCVKWVLLISASLVVSYIICSG